MDGVTAVEARIADIRGRIASLSAPTRPSATGSTAAFGAALSAASAPAPPAAGSAPPSAGLSAQDHLAALRLRPASSGSPLLSADGAPAALAAYGNGQVPAGALESIGQGGHRLWEPAAASFRLLHAAATRDGVDIGVTDSYRSFDAQVDLAARKGLYSEGGLAAKPGTSDHGWGRALDLDLDAGAQAWMRTNGASYGFVEDTPREPWHWVFTPRS